MVLLWSMEWTPNEVKRRTSTKRKYTCEDRRGGENKLYALLPSCWYDVHELYVLLVREAIYWKRSKKTTILLLFMFEVDLLVVVPWAWASMFHFSALQQKYVWKQEFSDWSRNTARRAKISFRIDHFLGYLYSLPVEGCSTSRICDSETKYAPLLFDVNFFNFKVLKMLWDFYVVSKLYVKTAPLSSM